LDFFYRSRFVRSRVRERQFVVRGRTSDGDDDGETLKRAPCEARIRIRAWAVMRARGNAGKYVARELIRDSASDEVVGEATGERRGEGR